MFYDKNVASANFTKQKDVIRENVHFGIHFISFHFILQCICLKLKHKLVYILFPKQFSAGSFEGNTTNVRAHAPFQVEITKYFHLKKGMCPNICGT